MPDSKRKPDVANVPLVTADTPVDKSKLVGQNYVTPDLVAKVTGKARYSEDFRAEGMLFAKLLLSPYPHARILDIDTSRAQAMAGVRAIITMKDLPPAADYMTDLGVLIKANPLGERGLAMEPVYQGEPIVAVAAVDELTAADAIEKIRVTYEPLPYVIDPLASLRPGGPNARVQGNAWGKLGPEAPVGSKGSPPVPQVREIKWTEEEFRGYDEGKMPRGTPTGEWSYGDVEGGFQKATLVLDESFRTPNTSHQCLESRSSMAYWQGGKLHIFGSTQSTSQTLQAVARWMDMKPEDIVLVSEYTGGGYGSKVTSSIHLIIPSVLSKKCNAPVFMRITREDENYIGRARPSFVGRMKAGFGPDGRLLALDMFVVADNGPYDQVHDTYLSSKVVSLLYQPLAMRWRGISVLTNTPPRSSQSSPGGLQGVSLMEPVLAKAAHRLNIDLVAIHRINAPEGQALFGPATNGKRDHVTGCFMKEAIDHGARRFRWEERHKANSRKRNGSKIRGVGMSSSSFKSGSRGFDGLFVIEPDGKMYIQSGIGNLGTENFSDVHRVAAQMMGMPWEKVVIVWGDTSKHLPWTCISGGSQTSHAMTRAAYAAASDGIRKLQQIAARDHGGRPDEYEVRNERVYRKGGGPVMTLAQAARRAIALGGVYDGHQLPKDINPMTVRSAKALAGRGLMGVARDDYQQDGTVFSFVASFAEVEIDVETGMYKIIDFLAVADAGRVIHPAAIGGQILGRSMLGIGHAIGQRWVFDQHLGLPVARRFYQTKPPTILDAPSRMDWAALNIPDPSGPVGAKGIGEPPVPGGCCAILNAISDALGDDIFRRAPVTLDMILTSLEYGHPVISGLASDI